MRQTHISGSLEQRNLSRWMGIILWSLNLHQRGLQRCMRNFWGDYEGVKHMVELEPDGDSQRLSVYGEVGAEIEFGIVIIDGEG